MARDGLRAQLVIAELDDDTFSEVRQIAIRDAVREALRNTLKHAGTDPRWSSAWRNVTAGFR
jgi:anti-sigma regulatory factor (Ser/Thr protein kinase)